MIEKTYKTPCGVIHYWVNEKAEAEAGANGSFDPSVQLVFLPGLTADHRLFRKQVEYFEDKCRVFVWDAPGHAASWPFSFCFRLEDKAKWLDEILILEGIDAPIIVGQSMGGYLGQMYAELFPEKLRGFISIDSAPLQRSYYTAAELWLLKRMEPVYRHYPWKTLLRQGCNGVASTEQGRALMRDIMMTYDGDQERYAQLAGNGYWILCEAVEEERPYEIKCPALLICGDKDHAGSTMRYNRAWHKRSGLPIVWLEGAGHNSNTDQPEVVNQIIEDFVAQTQ